MAEGATLLDHNVVVITIKQLAINDIAGLIRPSTLVHDVFDVACEVAGIGCDGPCILCYVIILGTDVVLRRRSTYIIAQENFGSLFTPNCLALVGTRGNI